MVILYILVKLQKYINLKLYLYQDLQKKAILYMVQMVLLESIESTTIGQNKFALLAVETPVVW